MDTMDNKPVESIVYNAFQEAVDQESQRLLEEDRTNLANALYNVLNTFEGRTIYVKVNEWIGGVRHDWEAALKINAPANDKKDLRALIQKAAAERVEHERRELRAPIEKFRQGIAEMLDELEKVRLSLFSETDNVVDTSTVENAETALPVTDAAADKENALLNKAISSLNMSEHMTEQRRKKILKCMWRENIKTLRDLIRLTEEDLLAMDNFGWVSLGEVKRGLAELGLSLRKPNDESAETL